MSSKKTSTYTEEASIEGTEDDAAEEQGTKEEEERRHSSVHKVQNLFKSVRSGVGDALQTTLTYGQKTVSKVFGGTNSGDGTQPTNTLEDDAPKETLEEDAPKETTTTTLKEDPSKETTTTTLKEGPSKEAITALVNEEDPSKESTLEEDPSKHTITYTLEEDPSFCIISTMLEENPPEEVTGKMSSKKTSTEEASKEGTEDDAAKEQGTKEEERRHSSVHKVQNLFKSVRSGVGDALQTSLTYGQKTVSKVFGGTNSGDGTQPTNTLEDDAPKETTTTMLEEDAPEETTTTTLEEDPSKETTVTTTTLKEDPSKEAITALKEDPSKESTLEEGPSKQTTTTMLEEDPSKEAITTTCTLEENPPEEVTGLPKYKKVSEFSNNPDHKVKRVVCNETFKKLLMKHLQSKGMKYLEIKEEYMDDAFKDAKYDYIETEVECGAIQEFPPVLQHIGDPFEYPNNDDTPSEEEYSKEIEYTEGLEHSKTNCSEWSICGGLSAEYQGAGASANVGYTKSQSQTVTKFKGKTQTQTITKQIFVPPKHSRSVVLIQRYQRKECKAKNVKLVFPKSAKIKCKIHNYRDSNSKSMSKDKFFIRDVLKDYIEYEGANPLTAWLEGKYVWVETSVFLKVSDPKPIGQ